MEDPLRIGRVMVNRALVQFALGCGMKETKMGARCAVQTLNLHSLKVPHSTLELEFGHTFR